MPVTRVLPVLLALLLLLAAPSPSRAQLLVRVEVAPPLLPVYVQPVIPGPDYIWVPGYWAWGPDGYFWVPGTWVFAPAPGLLWTPGYWAWADGYYLWHAGYWGPHVGFYGGINYGCGYTGLGYHGGYWRGGAFFYNATVNVGAGRITNVYRSQVTIHAAAANVSYNGGKGGVTAQPNAQELAAAAEKHVQATDVQAHHEHSASGNHALLASVNGGHPAIAATAVAGHFAGQGVVAAKAYGAVSPAAAVRGTQTQQFKHQGLTKQQGPFKPPSPLQQQGPFKPQGQFKQGPFKPQGQIRQQGQFNAARMHGPPPPPRGAAGQRARPNPQHKP